LNDNVAEQIASGERFAFGRNWRRFLDDLDDQRVQDAKSALCEFLECGSLDGSSFFDAGSGSGLMSLAAFELGARPVTSFDFDPEAVACTRELRTRARPSAADSWRIERGSLLDADFLARLGEHDVVYCWGVAHHTGAMWEALANLIPLVRPGGRLFVAIYHDQGRRSRAWYRVKRAYARHGMLVRAPLVAASALAIYVPRAFGKVARRISRRAEPRSGRLSRGMSRRHDLIDWVGGFPFECARPEEIVDFFTDRGLTLQKLETSGGRLGCNQFVFRRLRAASSR